MINPKELASKIVDGLDRARQVATFDRPVHEHELIESAIADALMPKTKPVTISQFCQQLELQLKKMRETEVNEAIAAIIHIVDPPKKPHQSGCATSCAPAYRPTWCDCGATKPIA